MPESVLATPILADPCARCGTTGGPSLSVTGRPYRTAGERWGVPGPICRDCRARLAAAERRVKLLLPCARCGTPGGRSPRPGDISSRYDGGRFGICGKICLDCQTALTTQRRAAREAEDQAARQARRGNAIPTAPEVEAGKAALYAEQRVRLSECFAREQRQRENGGRRPPADIWRRGARQARREFRAAWKRIVGEDWTRYIEVGEAG